MAKVLPYISWKQQFGSASNRVGFGVGLFLFGVGGGILGCWFFLRFTLKNDGLFDEEGGERGKQSQAKVNNN